MTVLPPLFRPLRQAAIVVVGLSATAAFAALATPAAAQVDTRQLEQSLATWYASASRSAPGTWGISVADQSGKFIWGIRPDEPLVPASTVKLFTTGFARSVLGPDARRPTRVTGTGFVDSTTGDWVGTWGLQLNGDPTLERVGATGPTFYDLALQLAKQGVRRISGPLEVESIDGPADAVYPTAWSPRHRGRLFAPLIGPLMLHENVVWFTVQPGARPGQAARLVGEAPDGIGALVTMAAKTRSGRRSSLSLKARKGGGWVITGSVGVRARPRTLSAVSYNPKAVLGAVWAASLRRAGIQWIQKNGFPAPKTAKGLQPKVLAEPTVLAEVASPPLDSVASEVNRRSLNFGAELLLQWAGGRSGAADRLVEHVREVTGLDSMGLHLVDGSGLSYDDRVTPSTFISYLARFPRTTAGRNFPLLLPANGSGTLHRLATGFPGAGVVRAKTGTLGQVSTVVGYLGRPDGVLLVSLMYNGPQPYAARQAQWRLFRLLGADGVVIPNDTFSEAAAPQLGGEDTEPSTWAPADSTPDADTDAP